MSILTTIDIKIFYKARLLLANIKSTIEEYNINKQEIIGKKIPDAFIVISKILKIGADDIIFSNVYYEGKNIYEVNDIINDEVKKLDFLIMSTSDENDIRNNIKNYNKYSKINEKKYLTLLKNVDVIINASIKKIINGSFDYHNFVSKYPSGGYLYIVKLLDFVINIQNYKLFYDIIVDINIINEEKSLKILQGIVDDKKLVLLFQIFYNNSDKLTKIFTEFTQENKFEFNNEILNMFTVIKYKDVKFVEYLTNYFKSNKDINSLMTLLYFSISDKIVITKALKTLKLNKYDKEITDNINNIVS